MSRQEEAYGLLSDVRNYLDITWDDPAGDRKLVGIILRGMDYIDARAGKEMDYMEEGAARALLMDYCMYARSGAIHEFGTNYLRDLTALRISQIEVSADADL
jgi:hypothetical protein